MSKFVPQEFPRNTNLFEILEIIQRAKDERVMPIEGQVIETMEAIELQLLMIRKQNVPMQKLLESKMVLQEEATRDPIDALLLLNIGKVSIIIIL